MKNNIKYDKEDLLAALPNWFRNVKIGECFNYNGILYKRISSFQFIPANEENEQKRIEYITKQYQSKKTFIQNEINKLNLDYKNNNINSMDYEIKLTNYEKDLEKLESWYKINSSPNCVIEFHPNYLIQRIKNSLVDLDEE